MKEFNKMLILLGLSLSASYCRVEDENCHLSFKIINDTNYEILFLPSEVRDTVAYCDTQMYRIPPLSSYAFGLNRTCWEAEFSAIGGILQLFFFDAAGEAGKPITDCNDDLLNSQILERREITIEYLRNHNWVVEFP